MRELFDHVVCLVAAFAAVALVLLGSGGGLPCSVVFVATWAATWVALSARRRRRLNGALAAVDAAYSGTIDRHERRWTGTAHGVPLTVSYRVIEAAEGAASPWTELVASIPRQPGWISIKRRGWRATSARSPGVAVDLDDRRFEAEYLVEASPTEGVAALLDPPLREALLHIDQKIRITTMPDATTATLEIDGFITDGPSVVAATEVLVQLARRFP